MKFSICIPNYNYAKYVGRTIESVLQQTYSDFEILVSDNASTDESVDVIRAIKDPRIKLTINRCNVGFAGNLDRAARHATGDMMIMLSSDDLMTPEALETYARLIREHQLSTERLIISSSWQQIDGQDRLQSEPRMPRHRLWRDEDRVPEMDSAAGAPVYRVAPAELLQRSLRCVSNPLVFCSTAYSRKLYEAVEGYGGNRLIVPDKWFNWRMLGAAEGAYFIHRPLFRYRVHAANQASQESQAGALKYLMDEYAATFEIDAGLLAKANLVRADVEKAFIEYDVLRPALSLAAEGKRRLAHRTLTFGCAAYPKWVRSNPRSWALRAFLAAGPLGTWVASRLRARYRAEY
jgi:glycosyltransferase involved in cell wall biosynthesis